MITHILSYLIFASVVFFFEVIFPAGILGLAALALYGIAVFKAYVAFGITGAVATLIVGLVMAFFTAYWELRVLSQKRFAGVGFLKNRLVKRNRGKLFEASADLKGQEGTAFSDLAPFGEVTIAGKTYAVQSVSGPLQAGDKVRVVDVGVTGVRVEKI